MDKNEFLAYYIDNKVIFLPEKSRLISCKTGKQLALYVTASRCLQLLINNPGRVVIHAELYAAGWEDHGKIVTPNTLYQTISKLRRQLEAAGIEQNIIQTLPRQGWILNSEAMIEKQTLNAFSTWVNQDSAQPAQLNNIRNLCKRLFMARPIEILASCSNPLKIFRPRSGTQGK
ncbi:transcriptional regulator [Kalamiella sp. sgz302252]|uniref:winged helix-turn-helix domain-containing protein n=1 Tax=Pantoea sp. sgz302252 TaxID=3341827 RepID=UPI0036D3AEF4